MLEYHSPRVMNLACFVMYLLVVILFVMHIEGVFLRSGRGWKLRPLLGCLPEYRAIYPLCVQFSDHAFCSGPSTFLLRSVLLSGPVAAGPHQCKGSPWRTGEKVGSETSPFLWTLKKGLAREVWITSVGQEDIKSEDCDFRMTGFLEFFLELYKISKMWWVFTVH